LTGDARKVANEVLNRGLCAGDALFALANALNRIAALEEGIKSLENENHESANCYFKLSHKFDVLEEQHEMGAVHISKQPGLQPILDELATDLIKSSIVVECVECRACVADFIRAWKPKGATK